MSDFSKKSMLQVKENNDDLALIVENFDDAVIGNNLEGIIKSYNKAAERLYGYDKEEILGQSISILIPDENKNEIYGILEKIRNGTRIKHWETIRKTKNGELITVSISVSPIYDNSGKIKSIICIARDMTERQKLINELKESEEKYKFAVEGGNFGVWDWNMRTNIVYYSKMWKEMLGYNENEIGNSCNEWKNKIYNEDYAYVMDKLDEHFKGHDCIIEYRLKCKDNNYKWVRTRGKVIQWDSNGEPIRMIGTNEDINEETILRKKTQENENRLRGIYDSMNIGLILGEIVIEYYGKQTNYKYLHINKAMKKIIGENTLKVLQNDEKDWINMFGESAINGKTYTFEDYNKALGKYFDVNIYSPNPMQFAVLINDVTEIKKKELELIEKYDELSSVYEELTATEEELRKNYKALEVANEEIKKANRAKSQFLANMSHELRTPLNGILGCTQLLQFTKLENEQREYLSMIEKSSNNLLQLINDILNLSKIEAGRVELKYEEFNLNEQMACVINDLTLLAKDKDIEIMYYVDPFSNKVLIGDIFRLKQILYNLISNAVKFTEHGHIYFKVNVVSKTTEETKLQFSVEDTGKGISDDFKNEIFKEFTQEEAFYTRKFGGTGLGLAISEELVKMMNGNIGFESEVGKGSKFYFTAVFKNINNQDCYFDTKNNMQIQNGIKKDKNILVVEDNEINLKIVSEFLKQLNYKHSCVHNGQEAIKFLEENEVDIILMDIQMPVLNGYDATKIIRDKERKTGKHKIIIAMTAYTMQGDREKFINCGMDDYISKPFDITILNALLSGNLRGNLTGENLTGDGSLTTIDNPIVEEPSPVK